MADDTQTASDAIRDEVKASREVKEKESDDKATENGKASEDTAVEDIEAIAQQANNPDAVKNALTAERTAAKEAREQADKLAKKVKDYEDRDKSEQEKLEERASSAEDKVKALEGQVLRYEVAEEKNLPRKLADRLQGKNKRELEEDADRLLELVKPNRPAGDSDAGKGEGGEGSNFNDEIRSAAGR